MIERFAVVLAAVERLRTENERLLAENEALRKRIESLEERLGTDSGNSSQPPSQDGPASRARRPKKKRSGRKRGAQPGHKGHFRALEPEAADFAASPARFGAAAFDLLCHGFSPGLCPEDAS